MKLPKKNENYRQIVMYVVFASFCIVVMLSIMKNIDIIVPKFLDGISTFLSLISPFIMALVIVYLLNPIVNFINGMFDKAFGNTKKNNVVAKIDNIGDMAGGCESPSGNFDENKLNKRREFSFRGISVMLTYLIVAVVVFLILSGIISSIGKEIKLADTASLKQLAISLLNSGQEFVKEVSEWLSKLGIESKDLSKYQSRILDWLNVSSRGLASGAFSFVSSVGSFISKLLIALILSIYIFIDLDNLKNYWKRVSRVIFREKGYGFLSMIAKDADECFSGYIKGQFLDACVMAILVIIGLSVVGVKYSILIGILTGIGNLIPYIGPIFAYGGTLLACLVDGDISKLIIGLIVVVGIQTIDGNIINPKLLSDSISINPMLVIVALLVGGSLGGILGMLIAVPVAALLKKELDRFIAWRESKAGRVK